MNRMGEIIGVIGVVVQVVIAVIVIVWMVQNLDRCWDSDYFSRPYRY